MHALDEEVDDDKDMLRKVTMLEDDNERLMSTR